MAILKKKELKKMQQKDIDAKLAELKLELAKERAQIAIGASVTSPGRIKEIRRTIARMSSPFRATPSEKSGGVKTTTKEVHK